MKPGTPLSLELRHNGEALGSVCAGAVEADDRLECAAPRFWHGLRALRRAKSVCAIPQRVDVHVVMALS